MSGKLEKMKILCFTDPQFLDRPVNAFIATFNPESYSTSHSIEYYEKKASNGTEGGEVGFVHSMSRQMTFKFLFDGTGVTGIPIPVTAQVEHFLQATANVAGEIHRPHYLILNWGTLLFKCVLTNAEVNYTLFTPSGIPLRATINATFYGHIDPVLASIKALLKSPDLTREVTVKAGDTLPLLCHQVYGDASFYPDVAKINKIKNPRSLRDGQKIIFPPIIDLQDD